MSASYKTCLQVQFVNFRIFTSLAAVWYAYIYMFVTLGVCMNQAVLNCSSPMPSTPISSASSCVSLYHYRGHRRGGYFFSLQVIAGYGKPSFASLSHPLGDWRVSSAAFIDILVGAPDARRCDSNKCKPKRNSTSGPDESRQICRGIRSK